MTRTTAAVVAGLALLLACCCAGAFSRSLPVRVMTLDAEFAGGYQVCAADVDGDGRLDVLGLGQTVAWLRNPTWEKLTITGDRTQQNIDLAPCDVDGDGRLDLVVASDFSMNNTGSGGTLAWFRRSDDLKKPWIGSAIDAEPTSHRVRWADVEGTGRKRLIDAPIMGPGTRAPEYDQSGARLVMYRVPADPSRHPWPKQVIDTSLPVIHALQVIDWDGEPAGRPTGREALLTASRQGVHLFRFRGAGNHLTWTKTRLCAGDQDSSPAKGCSEVRVGRLKGGRRFIATIEPWHGNKVVVYHAPESIGALWQRSVIDETLDEGHALWTADLDGDGTDEIVAGARGKRHGLFLYRALDRQETGWERSVLDEEIACQGIAGIDLRNGGRGGIVAIGGATHNLRLLTFP
jgi:hypothetical protein